MSKEKKKSVRLEFDQSDLDKLEKKARKDPQKRRRKILMQHVLIEYANNKEK